jgi:beta-galactosidase
MNPLLAGPAHPQTHTRPTRLQQILFGAPYYPEHWDATLWERDAQLMAAAHFNVARLGEFAWDLLEPQPGEMRVDFFREIVALLGRYGIRTIFCTPTATPPRWLTGAYPEVLRVLPDGRRCTHGSRQHACYAGELYRSHSRRITRALAQAFAADPNVVGWQTDNEINCFFSECTCPTCQVEFQRFLQLKYGDIAALNRAWGTPFWAQTYTSFDQIELPYEFRPQYENPSARLDYFRYLSFIAVRFQREQVRELRAANPQWFVMHNGIFGHLDYHEFSQDLDFLGFGNYPGFTVHDAPNAAEGAAHIAARLDQARSYAGNIIIPEQQSGPGGQKPYLHDTPLPGEMRLWSYQSLAHGADGVLHFRWRSCRYGAEEYWCGILDHDSRPRRRYAEAQQEGAEFAALSDKLLGTTVHVDIGILHHPDQDDAHAALPHGLPTPTQAGEHLQRELWLRKYAVGYVNPADSWAEIKLLVWPHWVMCDAALAAKLTAYVRAGGTLLLGGRSAIKTMHNTVIAETPPGLLTELVGATVEEYGMRPERHYRIRLAQEVPAMQWYDVLAPTTAVAVGWWHGEHLEGLPAVTVNRVGQGKVIYVGTYFARETASWIADLAIAESEVKPLLRYVAPPVEVTLRESAERKLLFLLNHDGQHHHLHCLPAGRELLTDTPVRGELSLAPRQVAIIEIEG